MRLVQVQLQGFKSFVARTVISFSDNISCIVGPNGCGKSNIVDAVRWVMGEMSAKQLRGGSMEDVIFHGTEEMPGVGMAEVTLVFDNSQGHAPPEYSGFSEIQLTRRLFRNGESEYLINRTPCRLKDITDLFLGSGAGTKAYSIVEQGKIEEIITMKPEQRRILIEEAAGVSKYRARKLEATRKMEATRTNLERARDIIAELKRQMNSLNRQAKKAERYKKYRAELKDLDIEFAARKAAEVKDKLENNGSRMKDIENTEIELAARIESAEAALEARKESLLQIENKLANWQNRVMEATKALEKAEHRLISLRHQKESMERDKTRTDQEIQKLREKQLSIEEEIKSISAETANLEEMIQKARAELEQAERTRAEKENECSELREASDVLERHAASSRTSVSRLAERIEYAKRREQEIEQEKRELEQTRAGLEQSLESLASTNLANNEKIYKHKRELNELRAGLEKDEDELAGLKKDHAVCKDRMQSLKDRYAQADIRLKNLKEMERNYEGYQAGVKAVMERKAELEAQGKNGTYGLIADAITPEPGYEVALEAVLGERLQTIAVETSGHCLENIRFLMEADKGRSNFAPVKEISTGPLQVPEELKNMGAEPLVDRVSVEKELEPAVRAMIGDALVVDDLEAAARAVSANGSCSLVTKEGVIRDRIGMISGGSADSFPGILRKKREMEELAALLQSLAEKKQKQESELSELQRNIQEKQQKIESTRERLYALQIEKNNLQKDLRHGTEAYNSIKERIQKCEQDIKRCQETSSSLQGEIQQAHSQAEKEEEACRRIENELEERRAVLETIHEEQEAQAQRCTSLKVNAASLKEKIEAAKAQLHKLQASKAENSQAVSERERQSERIKLDIQNSAAGLEAAEKEREHAVLAAKELEQGADAERARHQQEAESVREQEQKIKHLGRQKEETRAERMETQLEIDRLKLQWEGIADNLRDRYSRELEQVIEECVQDLQADYPQEEKRERREELRQKIERMGDVNLTAIEEFEEISQRHSFLTNQEADLIAALENLEETIAKINSAYRKAFKKTFEKVDQNFQEVVPSLFNGGKGHLELTNPDDLLESGVELMVQLPGKRFNSITLLSGGEKALAAVALIISLFLVKPSPFCLFDEVDASLDDANIARFNSLMKTLSEKSQLILVTHNKRTMELGQTLYGVTMEKKGVSKLVSVRIADAEKTHAA